MQADAYCQTAAERQFLADVRAAAHLGVGYGWMQQVIEAEGQRLGMGAWGPTSFAQEIQRLEAEIVRLPHATA